MVLMAEENKETFNFEKKKLEYIVALKKCLESGDVKLNYFGKISVSDNDSKSTLDQAFREVTAQILATTPQKHLLENIVNMAISACEKDISTATVPVLLLSDIFDYLTVEKCEELFEFVEYYVDTWKRELFFNNTKNNLLRMCNDLLRRLSRSQNTVFCGRILLFLAKFFPLSERSGLNIVSEFNLDNSTIISMEDDGDVNDVLTDREDVIEDGESHDSKSSLTVDYNLYRKFWSMQDAFRNPAQCYNKLFWKTFAAHSNEVLKAFSSFKLDYTKSVNNHLDPVLNTGHDKHVYFAKYLTNLKLLELQLNDTNFRRYILVQFLILFQYLTSTVKFKMDNYVVTEDQSQWIKNTTIRIYKLLEETPPDGLKFAKSIEHILKREEHWNHWKNEGCPEFRNPPVEATDKKSLKPARVKRTLGDEIHNGVANKKILLGNAELTRLWNLCPDNMEACRSQKRDFLPYLETFFEEAIEQIDPVNKIEDKYKHVYNSNYGWRALRLLARRSPHFFTPSNQPISKLPLYLETMIKKLAKELPQHHAYEDKQDVAHIKVDDMICEDDELLRNNEDPSMKIQDETGQGKDGDAPESQLVTSEHLQNIAEKLGKDWKNLAPFLGCLEDEISYFESDNSTMIERARKMLIIWLERTEEDATIEAMTKALCKANLSEIAKCVFKDDGYI